MAKTFKIEDGVLIFKNIPDQEYIDDDEREEIPNYRGAFTTIKFPRNFETLCDGDFHYCRDSLSGVTCLDFSEAVNIDDIEGDTFTGMKSLEEVSLPVKIDYIPAFRDCPKLKVVHISRLEDTDMEPTGDGDKRLTVYAYNVKDLDCFYDDFIADVGTIYVPAGYVKRLRKFLEEDDQELDVKPLPDGAKFPPVVGGNSQRSTSTAGTSTGGKTFSLYLESVGRSNLAVVKLLKDTLGLDLAQAKRLADSAPCYICKDSKEFDKLNALDSKLSVLGAKTVLSSRMAGEEPEEQEKGSLYLILVGKNKLRVINLLRDKLGLDLSTSRQLVDSAPCYVCHDMDLDAVQSLSDQLKSLGAQVRVESDGVSLESGDTGSLYLESVGRNRPSVMRLFMTELGMDISHAKEIVNSAPCYVCEDIDLDVARSLAEQLVSLGAEASVKGDEAVCLVSGCADTEEETSEGGSFDLNKVFAGTLYYCVLDGQQFGPVTARQFSNMARYGVVDANTLVWANGMSQWVVAQSVAELQNLV